MKLRLIASAAVAALLLVGGSAPAQTPPAAAAADATPHYGAWGFDLAGQDKSVRPGDDFNRFASGVYLDHLVIPSDKARIGMFDTLTSLSQARLYAIIQDVAAHPYSDPSEQRIGDLYKSYMDEKGIEARGTAPLEADLARVRAVSSKDQMAAFMGGHDGFGAGIFGLRIGADPKNPDRNVVSLGTGGLGLPDRDYYLQASFADKKAAYEAYVEKLLTLAGWADPAASAKAVVGFETELAGASWSRVEMRNTDRRYNPMATADLPKYAPGFDWKGFFAASQLSDVPQVIAIQNTALPKFAAIYDKTPLATLKAWEAFHITDDASALLPDRFEKARFDFKSRVLAGVTQEGERWKRAVALVNGELGQPLGRIYLSRYFTADAKAKAESLVDDIKTALKGRIERNTWMTPQTKAQALDKMSKFTVRVAYPSPERPSKLEIKADDLYGNVERTRDSAWKTQLRRLHQPVNRRQGGMSPQTVNASYSPPQNQITIPAAILQPPFFDPNADPAINYGAIGGVIGHEMTHGFDDQGRKYDGTGKLRDWWTPADSTAFEERAARLGAQYSAFEPLPGAHINGQLTMGENIADSGGLLLALDAYHASLHGKPAPVIDGLTGDQRVFLGWAQVWRAKGREEAVRRQLVSDPHSPPEARVNAVMRNVDAWYDAWGVKPGDKLYLKPEDRVHIW